MIPEQLPPHAPPPLAPHSTTPLHTCSSAGAPAPSPNGSAPSPMHMLSSARSHAASIRSSGGGGPTSVRFCGADDDRFVSSNGMRTCMPPRPAALTARCPGALASLMSDGVCCRVPSPQCACGPCRRLSSLRDSRGPPVVVSRRSIRVRVRVTLRSSSRGAPSSGSSGCSGPHAAGLRRAGRIQRGGSPRKHRRLSRPTPPAATG
mmetsp:Transcript_13410/g.39594  ORF Transcript_13410/g.39594 Transcript_13410/m.39594 type:complete len:205 (+) Transcript_13410:126-740(+)